MFTRLPSSKRRKHVYLRIDAISASGDQDLPNVPRLSPPEIQKYEKLLDDNRRLNGLLSQQTTSINNLRAAISSRDEEMQTLKAARNIPNVSAITAPLNEEIALLKTDLDNTKQALQESKTLYEEARRQTNRLTRQFHEVTNDIATGLFDANKIPMKAFKDSSSIEEVLADFRLQLKEAVEQQKMLVEERTSLAATATSLNQALQIAITEKNNIINTEKSKWENKLRETQDALSNVQSQLSQLQTDYARVSNENNASKDVLKQEAKLVEKLQQAESRLMALEQACKDSLRQATQQSLERILTLETENRTLLQRLADMNKVVDTVSKSETVLVKDLNAECNRAKQSLAPMLPFLTRQLFIFDATGGKAAASANQEIKQLWKSFQTNNQGTYDIARQIVRVQDTRDCKDILSTFAKASDVYSQVKDLEMTLTNLFEDISGAVRVYVRIRPLAVGGGNSTVSKNGKSVNYNGTFCGSTVKSYGRFFGVIPDTFKNADVYTGCKGSTIDTTLAVKGHAEPKEQGNSCCLANDAGGMCRAFNQIANGYHVVLFGYGHSGSGKTLTLLGGDTGTGTEAGLAQLAVANISAQSVNIKAIFELAYDKIDVRSKNFNSGKFISLFHKTPEPVLKNIPPNMLVNEERAFDVAILNAGLEPSSFRRPISALDLSNLRKVLDNYRSSNRRILATPNNPQSSRSHLFIMLEFVFKNKKGYLTIVDMGGRESAVDILEMFLEKPEDRSWQLTSLLMNDPRLYPNFLKPHVFTPDDPSLTWLYDPKRYTQDPAFAATMNTYVKKLNDISQSIDSTVEVIKESMYINETINQLILFFKQKQDPNRTVKNFNMKEHRLPLDDKNNTYDPAKFLAGIPSVTTDRMGMFRILNRLSSYGGKPCKFVMLCNIRQESNPAKFCLSTKETLEFAHAIRST